MTTVQTGQWMEDESSVTVDMGDIAWLDGKYGDYQIIGSAGAVRSEGNAHPSQRGIITSNLSTCFVVAIIGRRGSIVVHVPGYLGHTELELSEQGEMVTMRETFLRVWNSQFDRLIDPPMVVLVGGSYTMEYQMNTAIGRVCPEILAYSSTQHRCEKYPNLIDSRHGKVMIKVNYQQFTGNELYVEGVKVL